MSPFAIGLLVALYIVGFSGTAYSMGRADKEEPDEALKHFSKEFPVLSLMFCTAVCTFWPLLIFVLAFQAVYSLAQRPNEEQKIEEKHENVISFNQEKIRRIKKKIEDSETENLE